MVAMALQNTAMPAASTAIQFQSADPLFKLATTTLAWLPTADMRSEAATCLSVHTAKIDKPTEIRPRKAPTTANNFLTLLTIYKT